MLFIIMSLAYLLISVSFRTKKSILLNFHLCTAKNPAPAKATYASKPAAGGPTRLGGRGGAPGPGRTAQQPSRPAGGAGGSSAALVQKEAQIQDLNNEVC